MQQTFWYSSSPFRFFLFHHIKRLCHSLNNLLQLSRDGVTYLGGGIASSNVLRSHTGLDDVAHCGLDGLGLLWEVEGEIGRASCRERVF